MSNYLALLIRSGPKEEIIIIHIQLAFDGSTIQLVPCVFVVCITWKCLEQLLKIEMREEMECVNEFRSNMDGNINSYFIVFNSQMILVRI